MTGRNAIGTVRYREYYDEYAAKNQTTGKMAVALMVKMEGSLERTELHLKTLKGCKSKFLMRYQDVINSGNELWVVIPVMIN